MSKRIKLNDGIIYTVSRRWNGGHLVTKRIDVAGTINRRNHSRTGDVNQNAPEFARAVAVFEAAD